MKVWVKFLHAVLLCVAAAGSAAQALPTVANGRIERLANMSSRFVDPRHVDVWLPDGYSTAKRYSVLYMQDGQALFDGRLSWDKESWHVDVTLSGLMREGRVPDTIVVAIWNTGKYRFSEYFPQKFLASVSEPFRRQYEAKYLENRPQADNYLRFIVEELKPAIDARYATRPGRASTFIMGSSMGGMISVYAMNEYPQVFGGAAGLSIAWISGFEPNFELPLAGFNYLRDKLAPPQDHRLYMDHGTLELDRLFGVYQAFVDEIVRDRGYTSANWRTWRVDGTGHNVPDWAARLEVPLIFLLGRGAGAP